MHKYYIFAFKLALLVLIPTVSLAQSKPFKDTLKLSIDDADRLFLQKNLLLLASQYDIEEAKAGIVQAKLYENPTVYYEVNVYNKNTRKFFDNSQSGEFMAQASQLIILAGKRNNRIKLGEINAKLAEYQFYDLLRTLKYELHSNLIELYFLQNSYETFIKEIGTLRQTVSLYQYQYEKGNIALKEVIRLKAFLFELENNSKDMYAQITSKIATLHILLNTSSSSYIVPTINKITLDSVSIKNLNLPQLIDSAKNNRADLKAYKTNIQFEERNLALQKSLAVPDIRVGGAFDRNGNYIPNYYALTFAMDLPVFNRNQGNIKIAQNRIEKSKALSGEYENRVDAEVMSAYSKAIEFNDLYLNFDRKFTTEFDKLIDGILRSYEKKNITLIEFIDFYESYKNSVIEMNKLKTDRINAFEELNFSIGKSVITY